MAAQFNTLYTKAGKLAAPDEDSLRQEVHRVAVLNLRKMIPPHARCEIPARIRLDTVLNFRPLESGKETASQTLGELLSLARLPSGGRHDVPFRTLRDLLLQGADPTQPQIRVALESSDWTRYCGVRVLQVSYRRLADLWMDLKAAVSEDTDEDFQSLPASPVRENLLQKFRSFLHRGFDLDPHLNDQARTKLLAREAHYCSRRVDDAPVFERDFVILNSEIDGDGSATATVMARMKNIYRARLRLSKPIAASGVPQFPQTQSSTQDSNTSQHGKCYTEDTCCALAVLHDLRQLCDAESTVVGPMPELTSERPVRLSWWGSEGQIESFEWPVPPLPTYAETSRFLGLWYDCLQSYLGKDPDQPTDQPISYLKPISPEGTQLLRRIHGLGKTCRKRNPTAEGSISESALEDLVQIWIMLGCVELLRSVSSRYGSPPGNELADILSQAPELDDAVKRSVDMVVHVQQYCQRQQRLPEFELLSKWVRGIIVMIHPENVTVGVSARILAKIDRGTDADESQIHEQVRLVRKVLSSERSERLESLWRHGKRELWNKLNSPKSISSELLIVLAEPEVATDKDIRMDLRDIRTMMQLGFARQELRALLSFSELQAATDADRSMESYRSAFQRFNDLRNTGQNDPEFVDEFIHLSLRVLNVLKRKMLWLQCRQLCQDLLALWRAEALESPIDAQRRNALNVIPVQVIETAGHFDQWREAETQARELLQICRKTLREAPESVRAQRELGNALDLCGLANLSQQKFTDALVFFEESRDVRRKLLHKLPDHTLAQRVALRDVSVSLENCGDVAVNLGQWSEAEALFKESLQIRDKLLEKSPDDMQAQEDLCVSLTRCGEVAMAQERLAQADTLFRDALQRRRKVLRKAPNNLQAERDLSILLNRCGDIAVKQDRWTQAESLFAESLLICRRILEKQPYSLQARRDLNNSLERCAEIAINQKQWSKAETMLSESLQACRTLVEQLPDSMLALRDLAASLQKCGNLAMEQEQWMHAEWFFSEALQASRKLYEQSPDSMLAPRDLADALHKCGDLAIKRELWTIAEKHFEEALQISRKQLEKSPESMLARSDLCVSLTNCGDLAVAQDDALKAAGYFSEMQQISEDMLKKSPDSLSAHRSLGIALESQGDLATEQGQWDRAAVFYAEALHVHEAQLRISPHNLQALRDLSGALDKCGETAVAQAYWDQARDFFNKSLWVSKRILDQSPVSLVAQNDLCISLGNCGDVAVELGDWSQADEYFSEALKISQALLQKSPDSAEAMQDVAIALEDCATVAEQLGKQDLAREQFEASVGLLRKVATAAHTDQLPPQIDLFHTTIQFAGFLLRTNAPAQARKLLEDPSIKKIASNLSASTDLSFEVRVLLGIRDFRMACLSRSATVREALFKKARVVFNDPELIPIIAREYSFRTAAAEFAAMESSASARKQSAPHRPSNSAKTSPKKTRRS
jgi:tetratricopeptide (TPR) repeat protein